MNSYQIEALKIGFYESYHAKGKIKQWVKDNIPNESMHKDSMIHFARIIERNPDCPGMIYGMLCNAFEKVLGEL